MTGSRKRSLRLEKGSWRLEARTTGGILLVLALLGLLSWLCLIQASRVSTAEYSIREKEAKIERLQRANAESLAEVVELLSVSRLEDAALGSGYVLAEERRYLNVPGYPGGLSAAPGTDANVVVSSKEPGGLPSASGESGVARWWEKVLSQFVVWAGKKP